jgi:hypothetical protein
MGERKCDKIHAFVFDCNSTIPIRPFIFDVHMLRHQLLNNNCASSHVRIAALLNSSSPNGCSHAVANYKPFPGFNLNYAAYAG